MEAKESPLGQCSGMTREPRALDDLPLESGAVEVFNLEGEQDWDAENSREGFRHRATRVGDRLGARALGAGLYELPPGEKTWPYHYTYGMEEWLLVVSGTPTLRSPEAARRYVRPSARTRTRRSSSTSPCAPPTGLVKPKRLGGYKKRKTCCPTLMVRCMEDAPTHS